MKIIKLIILCGFIAYSLSSYSQTNINGSSIKLYKKSPNFLFLNVPNELIILDSNFTKATIKNIDFSNGEYEYDTITGKLFLIPNTQKKTSEIKIYDQNNQVVYQNSYSLSSLPAPTSETNFIRNQHKTKVKSISISEISEFDSLEISVVNNELTQFLAQNLYYKTGKIQIMLAKGRRSIKQNIPFFNNKIALSPIKKAILATKQEIKDNEYRLIIEIDPYSCLIQHKILKLFSSKLKKINQSILSISITK